MDNYGLSDQVSGGAEQFKKLAQNTAGKAGKKVIKNQGKKIVSATAKKAGKEALKKSAFAVNPVVGTAVTVLDWLKGPILVLLVTILFLFPALIANGINLGFDAWFHTDPIEHPENDYEIESMLDTTDVETEDRKYTTDIVDQMKWERQQIDKNIEELVEKEGINFDEAIIIDNTYIPSLDGANGGDVAANAVEWAKARVAENEADPTRWRYCGFSEGNGACPICNPEQNNIGWQCIGFVSAAYFHGAGVPCDINTTQGKYCHLAGFGGNGGINDTLNGHSPADVEKKFLKRNGNDWQMITNNDGDLIPENMLQPGDVLLMYNGNSVEDCQHMALYIGNGEVAESSGGHLGKGAQINKYANWNGKRCRIVFRYIGKGSSATGVKSMGTSQCASDVINGACQWAEAIANDDSFHYGYTNKHGSNDSSKWNPNAHHNGCYFCGTNVDHGKRSKKGIVDFERTYCCNPFVHAAFAHGGGDPDSLKLCKSGTSYDWDSWGKSKSFKSMGNLPLNQLQRGDILCVTGHAMLYLGNGKLAEASGGDDNVKNSKKWNNSIRIDKCKKSDYDKVFRYVGKGGGQMELPSGSGNSGNTGYAPCSEYTELQGITKETGTRIPIGSVSNTINCAQSFAAVQDTYLVSFVNSDRPPSAVRMYDSNGMVLDTIYKDEIGHANGACSTPNDTYLVAGNTEVDSTIAQEFTIGNKVSYSNSKKLPYTASSIAYDKDTQKYILSAGGTIKVYDAEMNNCEQTISRNVHGPYYQDLGAGNGYIFACHTQNKGGENDGYNYIDIYNEETGDYCGSYTLDYGELESADVVDGELVLLVHILGHVNYIQKTGIMVGTGSGYDDALTRDVVAALAAFSAYEAELLPLKLNSLEEKLPKDLQKFILRVKDKYRRDIKIPMTLKAILKQNRLHDWFFSTHTTGLLEVSFTKVKLDDGTTVPVVEINHADGEQLAKFFKMEPDAAYTTETPKTEDVEGVSRLFKIEDEGDAEDYEIGDTNIQTAIETNTDTHMAMLFDNVNGLIYNKPVLCLPIKSLFTKIELSKTFDQDTKGVECKPKEGTKVYSCERSEVIRVVENDSELGTYIELKGYYRIIYAHLKTTKVEAGDMLNRNTVIGTSTDLFRIEIYDDNTPIDPEPLFVKKICLGSEFSPGSFFAPEGGSADVGSGEFGWPVPGLTDLSDGYGWRMCPFHGREFHNGLDIVGKTNDETLNHPVYAAESGTIESAGYNGGYGNCVIIKHDNGWKTLYGHLNKITKKSGRVNRGDLIGKVGSTGSSTGPHLHWTIYDPNGNTVDPMKHTKKVNTLQEMMDSASTLPAVKGMNPRLNSLASEMCWPNGTSESKYSKSRGNPKDAYVQAAQKYLGSEVREIRSGSRDAMTDCSYFVATLIRASGADPKFRALRFDYADNHQDWKYVSQGKKVDSSILMAGDVIQYKKKGGGSHVIIYLGNNTYAQASRGGKFPYIFKQNKKGNEMYNASKVRIETLQVIRNDKLAAEMLNK